MSELRRTSRTQRFRSRFTVALVVGALSGIVAVGALAQVASKSTLIGKLEGPEVVTDPAKLPKAFKEAPQLAELVKAGKLPPVAERIGQDPLVIKPLHEIGKYGGTWRGGFTGPADFWNGYRCCSGPDHLLFWDYTGNTVTPNIAKGYEMQDGGRTLVLHLRRGMKWSDGRPFTADDFVVLVRGHVPEQGPGPHALGGDGDQRQAGRDPEGRHLHGEVQVPRPVLPAARRAGGLHRPSAARPGKGCSGWAGTRPPTT